MGRWDDVIEDLLGFAQDDLGRDGAVEPVLVAFRGDQERLVAWLRPFPKGGYRRPIEELVALAVPLGADRYAAMFGGRAWSVDDPVPPVTADGDLRQRVVSITAVDGSARGEEPVHRNVLAPFELGDPGDPGEVGEGSGPVRWGTRIEHDLPVLESWIPWALDAAARAPEAFTASPALLRDQAERCTRLGHDVYLAPDVLALIATAAPDPPSPRWHQVRRAQPRRRARVAGRHRAWPGSTCR